MENEYCCPICGVECAAMDGAHCPHFIGWTDDYETIDMLDGYSKGKFGVADTVVELSNDTTRVFREN